MALLAAALYGMISTKAKNDLQTTLNSEIARFEMALQQKSDEKIIFFGEKFRCTGTFEITCLGSRGAKTEQKQLYHAKNARIIFKNISLNSLEIDAVTDVDLDRALMEALSREGFVGNVKISMKMPLKILDKTRGIFSSQAAVRMDFAGIGARGVVDFKASSEDFKNKTLMQILTAKNHSNAEFSLNSLEISGNFADRATQKRVYRGIFGAEESDPVQSVAHNALLSVFLQGILRETKTSDVLAISSGILELLSGDIQDLEIFLAPKIPRKFNFADFGVDPKKTSEILPREILLGVLVNAAQTVRVTKNHKKEDYAAG